MNRYGTVGLAEAGRVATRPPVKLANTSALGTYALLDVLDEDGEVVVTCDIPTAEAFRFIYLKLNLRVSTPRQPEI